MALEGLRRQTLPHENWELLLIDNASSELLSNEWDLSWHRHGRHIRENEIGLTPARLRGISEARGDLIIFVDDDNVLTPEYLEQSLVLANRYPFLGAMGGQVHAIYETEPDAAVKPYLWYLLDRRFDSARWGCDGDYHRYSPCGAGMIIRHTVALYYREQVNCDVRRRELGRRGTQLFSGEDSDMALCSHHLGLGNGLFPELLLHHLIPSTRLTPEFFIKVAGAGRFSDVLLRHLNDLPLQLSSHGPRKRISDFVRSLQRGKLWGSINRSVLQGEREAVARIRKWGTS